MRLVIVESPYAGDVVANVDYARACLADCLRRGEAPFASHLLYTQPGVLDDTDPAERALGIAAGLEWGRVADATVAYTDRGISRGMVVGIDRAIGEGRPGEYRTISEAPPGSPAPSGTDLPTGGDSSALRILDLAGVVVRALDEWEELFAALHPDAEARLRADVVRIVGGGR